MENKNQYYDINEYIIIDYEEYNNNLINEYSDNPILEPIINKFKQKNSERVKKKIGDILNCIIGKSQIDFIKIRQFMYDGIPDDYISLRPLLWKLLLNYLPGNINEWTDYFRNKRIDYENLKSDLSNENDLQVLDEIVKDVKRTKTHMHFFFMASKQNTNETNADVLARILYLFALLHPDIKYVQGMNELLAPIYYCFSIDTNQFFLNNIESDSFYCFEQLMLEIKEIFIKEKDHTSTGIHARLKNIQYMLNKIDPDLCNHFSNEKIEIEYFTFRWYTLLLTQEFNMPEILRLWDTMLVHNDKLDYISYLCLAIIIINRNILINKDFSNIMYVMQNIHFLDINIDSMISLAGNIKKKLNT